MRCPDLSSLVVLAFVPLALLAQPPGSSWELLYDHQLTIPLQDARFTSGTRRLAWLAADDKAVKSKNAGPEYLEFREDKTPMYKDDVVTFIPVASVSRLDYDHDKKLVRAAIRQSGAKDLVLIGSTKFIGINKFNLEGSAAKTPLSGAVRIQDGQLNVQGVQQPGAKPVEPPTGRPAVVVIQDKKKTEHKVHGLTPLYRAGTGEKLANVLMFQKVGQIDIAKITVLHHLPPADKKQAVSHDWEVTQAGDEKQKLTLLESTQLEGGEKATLVGLVGRVPAGYRLFPPNIIAEVRWEAK
jgi:hypothetical protein